MEITLPEWAIIRAGNNPVWRRPIRAEGHGSRYGYSTARLCLANYGAMGDFL